MIFDADLHFPLRYGHDVGLPYVKGLDAVEIIAIEIERQDGHAYCGTMEFRHSRRHATLLWTVEWQDTPEVLVEFFPGTTAEVSDVVRGNQKVLIDGLLDTLLQRSGRETLFT